MTRRLPFRFIPQSPDKRRLPPPEGTDLGFGNHFSQHYFHAESLGRTDWKNAIIQPSSALGLGPEAHCFHYGQTIFEGLKAYRTVEGGISIFRLEASAQRFENSARRLAMPPVPHDLYRRAVAALTLADQTWIPKGEGEALYLRPVMVSTDACVCVRPSDNFLFYVVAGPSGPLFSEKADPVSILVEDEDARAFPGGLGQVKTSANYAHSFRAHRRAAEKGYAQVLWLDAAEHRFVEEVGTMNIFFLFDDELVTPPLNGTILPGITRDSILTLTKSWGMNVVERPISIDEVLDSAQSGRLSEAFGTGTAAIVSSVGNFGFKGQNYPVNGGKRGELTRRIYKEISEIQRGVIPDKFGWNTPIRAEDFQAILDGKNLVESASHSSDIANIADIADIAEGGTACSVKGVR